MAAYRHTHRGRCSLASLLTHLFDLLLLEAGWLAEVNGDLVGGKLGVGMGHAVDFLFNSSPVKRVKVDALLSAASS